MTRNKTVFYLLKEIKEFCGVSRTLALEIDARVDQIEFQSPFKQISGQEAVIEQIGEEGDDEDDRHEQMEGQDKYEIPSPIDLNIGSVNRGKSNSEGGKFYFQKSHNKNPDNIDSGSKYEGFEEEIQLEIEKVVLQKYKDIYIKISKEENR